VTAGSLYGRIASPRERDAVAFGAAAFFSLLCGYFVLRAVRDALASEGGSLELAWNFTATFVGVVLATPLYAMAVARSTRERVAAAVYRSAAVVFVLWWVVLYRDDHFGLDPKDVRRGWFVWVSVFNLFATSTFWSLMADGFSPGQGRRLFGYVAAGGTLGAFVGGASVGFLAEKVGTANLLWFQIVALEVATRLAPRAARSARDARESFGEEVLDEPFESKPGAFEGARLVARSPMLRNLALYLAIATLTGAFMYVARSDLANAAYPDRDARASAFGFLDASSNALTFLVQILLASFVLRRFGAATSLRALPCVYALGAAVAALAPGFAAIAWTDVFGRAARHGVAGPARDALFTAVSRREKYGAKAFIDTVVYRLGDGVSVWIVAAVVALCDSASPDVARRFAVMSAFTIPVAAVWAWVGGRAAAAAPKVVAAKEGGSLLNAAS
jgi:ATP:ADP antiporter, AAA family